jgi:hypothetical protein
VSTSIEINHDVAGVWYDINELHVKFAIALLAYFTKIITGTANPNVPVSNAYLTVWAATDTCVINTTILKEYVCSRHGSMSVGIIVQLHTTPRIKVWLL